MPKSSQQEQREDYYARRRDFIAQLYEGNRQHKIEFYKQIMILSVAGLGYNLSPLIRDKDNNIGWRIPTNAWEASTSFFLLAIFGTLLLFFLHSWFDTLRGELIKPDIRVRRFTENLVVILRMLINFLAVASAVLFTFAVIAAIMSPIATS